MTREREACNDACSEETAMTMSLVFWVLMLLWLVFLGFWHYWPQGGTYPVLMWPLPFILFLLLGWATFGAPIR